MKKWIFPLTFIVLEIIFSILFLSPTTVAILPQFFIWIRDLFYLILTSISKLLHLPTFMEMGEVNYIFANAISLLIINILIFMIYFVVGGIVRKKRQSTQMAIIEDFAPKNEFDPVFFEKRVPVLRLVFIWVPLNLWILYYFLLNSLDMQANFAANSPGLYSVFAQNIDFYNANVAPLIANDDGVKFVVLFAGLVFFGGLYWIIFSFFATLFKSPIAKFKARKARADHEKRISKIQSEEMTIEDENILEHAKFSHNKSIADTIATIDIKEINEKSLADRHNYFDDLAHGIVDLGVQENKLLEVAKPNLEKKPLRVIYPSLDKTNDNKVEKEDVKVEEEKVEPVSNDNKIILNEKLDVLDTNEQPVLQSFEKEINQGEKVDIIKPLNPTNLRKPVKVIPVTPKQRPLKDLVGEEISGETKND